MIASGKVTVTTAGTPVQVFPAATFPNVLKIQTLIFTADFANTGAVILGQKIAGTFTPFAQVIPAGPLGVAGLCGVDASNLWMDATIAAQSGYVGIAG